MQCLSGPLIVQLLVTAAILAGAFMIAKLLLGRIQLGEPWPTAVAIAKIVFYVLVAIWIIYFLYDLISCVPGTFRLPAR